jgi:hypothetical protein
MPGFGLKRSSGQLASDDRTQFMPDRELFMSDSGIDPEVLRMIMERRRRQGMAGRAQDIPTYSPPARQAGYSGAVGSEDPRVLAALLRRKRLIDEINASRAPDAYLDLEYS